MPIYEYHCKDCQKSFEEIRPISNADDPIVCKYCQSTNTSRRFGAVSSHSKRKTVAHTTLSSQDTRPKTREKGKNIAEATQPSIGEKTIVVEAESLENAREQVQSRIPEGFYQISEIVLSDGRLKTVEAFADTIEGAFAKAMNEIPDSATIIEKKELFTPERKVITVAASDERIARYDARLEAAGHFDSKSVMVKSLNLAIAGQKGFLGIGKKPNQYEIELFQQAMVEITYKTRAKISAKAVSISALILALKDEDKHIRETAIETLVKVGTPAIEPLSVYIEQVPIAELILKIQPDHPKARAIVQQSEEEKEEERKRMEEEDLKRAEKERKRSNERAVKAYWRFQAQQWWARTGKTQCLCDWCSKQLNPRDDTYLYFSRIACEKCSDDYLGHFWIAVNLGKRKEQEVLEQALAFAKR